MATCIKCKKEMNKRVRRDMYFCPHCVIYKIDSKYYEVWCDEYHPHRRDCMRAVEPGLKKVRE